MYLTVRCKHFLVWNKNFMKEKIYWEYPVNILGGNGTQTLSHCHRGDYTVVVWTPTILLYPSEVPDL
jgi:hypothetical protein